MLSLSHIRYEILRDVVVRDFSLDLKGGEIKTLFGPSGCGKTTILRLVAGLSDPKEGEIRSDFKKIGFLFQENRLLSNLNALENIAIFMPKKRDNEERVYALGEKIGLEKGDFAKYPAELSGGMAKRVAFMRLLLSDFDLALLDEPFVGLDRDLRGVLADLLIERVERGAACLLVTHDRFEAARLSHEIMFLSRKEMKIERVLRLDAPLGERDFKFEEETVAREFEGRVYYE